MNKLTLELLMFGKNNMDSWELHSFCTYLNRGYQHTYLQDARIFQVARK